MSNERSEARARDKARRDNELYEKLRRKLCRVHPSNQAPDLPLRIELTYGEVARLSTAILAFARDSLSAASVAGMPSTANITEAIRVAKLRAGEEFGIAWYNLEEISRVELILAALFASPSDGGSKP
jgi:hypothetical protein